MDESVTPQDLKAVYTFGISQKNSLVDISSLLKPPLSYSKEKASTVVQKLIANRVAYFITERENCNFFAIREQEIALRLKSLNNEEAYDLYCMIEKANNKGVNSRDILKYTNEKYKKSGKLPLQQAYVTRLIKHLENEKLIKTVKSVHQKRQKILILYDLEPDSALVGGTFYQNSEFNSDLVERFREKIHKFILIQKSATQEQLISHVNSSELASQLDDLDIERVIKTLVLDQFIDEYVDNSNGNIIYSVSNWPSLEKFERIPCVSCPLQDSCYIDQTDHQDIISLRNVKRLNRSTEKDIPIDQDSKKFISFSSKITPATCPYLSQWLQISVEPWLKLPDNDKKQNNDE